MFMVIVQREVGGTKYQLDLGRTEVLIVSGTGSASRVF